jgi:AraC family transcriptional regulator
MAEPRVLGAMDVQAELRAPGLLAQLVEYRFYEPPASTLHIHDRVRIELCLNARHRSARACFIDEWSPQRYERIGEIFVVPPSVAMHARSDEDTPLKSVVCELELAPLMEMFSFMPKATEPLLLARLDVQNLKVRSLLLRLAEEVQHPGFGSRVLVGAIAAQMHVEMFRHAMKTGNSSVRGLAPWQLKRIDERLCEIREAPTLTELAAMCRLSSRQLTRGFSLSQGCSLGAYVARSQMEHAKRMLANGETVAVIAGALGFASSSNFCFAFRRTMGMTPGQYRDSLLRH